MENLSFNLNDLGSSDLESFILVQQAYKQNAFKESIMEIGFNTNSGYVYIALENGICISSCFGQDVEYITNDYESGEENFYNDYFDALESLNEVNEFGDTFVVSCNKCGNDVTTVNENGNCKKCK